jgi:hypothetical protein
MTVGPVVNASTHLSNPNSLSPPQYSSISSVAPKAAAPPYALMSSNQKLSLPPGIRPYDIMPTQLQHKLADFFSEIEPETEDERDIPLGGYNQLVGMLFSHVYSSLTVTR